MAPVFPLGRVMEFLRFLWPDRTQLEDRVHKYVNGYSEGYIQRWPGIGTVIQYGGQHWTVTTMVPSEFGARDATGELINLPYGQRTPDYNIVS